MTSKPQDIKKTAQRLMAEIDETEVACIIAETCCGMTRPEGQSAAEALRQIKGHNEAAYIDFTSAARRTLLYIQNQISKGQIAS